MSDIPQFENPDAKQKSFWKRPEGLTGMLFLSALVLGGGYLVVTNWALIIAAVTNIVYLSIMLMVLAAVVYMVLDPKMRNLVWYMYKSIMRKITGVFVQIDPIGILKSYVDDLKDNLMKMRKQIGALRGQMRKLSTLMEDNNKEISKNMKLAAAAKQKGMDQQVLLSTRKAARLKESNQKYQVLYQKIEILNRILTKMEKNSELLIEDTEDQVKLKAEERKAIRASHSAMKSAMSVMSGNPDQRAMFDAAMEHIADDLANKVGEMERFMEMSANFMDSVDLQNGIFEEEGMQMLEKWEKSSTLMLMEGSATDSLDLGDVQPEAKPQKGSTQYDNLFE